VLLTNSRSPVPDQKDYLKVGCAHSVKKETASRKRKSGPINQQGCANAMDRYYLKSSSENERKFLESLFMLFYCSSLHLSIYFHRPNE
jgi:hypothetical protein